MESLHVVIVGAGCFGVSTAVHLLQETVSSRPIYTVTVIDASDTIPAPDAASTDLNKIVRSSYSDAFYTSFARAAMREWTALGDAYHESGVLVFCGTTTYGAAAMSNDIDCGADILLENDPLVRSRFPEDAAVLSNLEHTYFNQNGGWANAAVAMTRMIARAKELGAQFLTGHTLDDLVVETETGKEGQRVVGIKIANGKVLAADIVILAMGAWTASSLCARRDLGIADKIVASGQCVAHIQLDEKLALKYSATPVILRFGGGFYMFPPTEDNIIKVALHGEGYTYFPDGSSAPTATGSATSVEDKVSAPSLISTPRTVRTHGERGLDIPLEMAQLLRANLRQVYPELADLPFKSTRICWYTDTRDEDWIIDEHPNHPNLYFATGGSGHAFKFLPILGSLVVQRLRNTLPPDIAAKFSWSRPATNGHGYRTGVTKALNNRVFATEADLSNTKNDPVAEVGA